MAPVTEPRGPPSSPHCSLPSTPGPTESFTLPVRAWGASDFASLAFKPHSRLCKLGPTIWISRRQGRGSELMHGGNTEPLLRRQRPGPWKPSMHPAPTPGCSQSGWGRGVGWGLGRTGALTFSRAPLSQFPSHSCPSCPGPQPSPSAAEPAPGPGSRSPAGSAAAALSSGPGPGALASVGGRR